MSYGHSKRKSQLLEDIDALLGDELANIESMEEAFKNSREPEHHIESIDVTEAGDHW